MIISNKLDIYTINSLIYQLELIKQIISEYDDN